MSVNSAAQLKGRFWPTPAEAPLRADGTLDVTGPCRLWDDAVNDGAATGPSVFEREAS